MKYLLDTNSCIDHLRRGLASPVTARLLVVPPADITICSVVRAELMLGAIKGGRPQGMIALMKFLSRFHSLPFDDVAADSYGQIRADLERLGLPIGPNDLLVAAIATTNNLTVVTNNLREFSRVPGLACEDWTLPIPTQP